MKNRKEEKTENKQEDKPVYPCYTCGKETVLCPMCSGGDPWVKDGQYDGFQICQDEKCKSYQFCCGC